MALGLYFQPSGFTPATYDEVIKQLEQAGAGFGKVPGRIFHCAMEAGGAIQVFDVWESMEQFQKFGETLLPILSKLGADPGEPQVATLHNMQNG
jgi:hypothetical protein